ncbi:MAG TPA: hypothetical protein VK213_04700 [Bacteroidales bacterium]|nr:hypothetical protein [Bacteroidales bacterium]
MKKILILLFLGYLTIPVFAQENSILIDASKKLFKASDRLNGSNLEDLNFQCYMGLYSQLLHGQDFEEHIDVDFLNLPSTYQNEGGNLRNPLRYVTFIVLDEKGTPYLTTRVTEGAGDGIDPVGYPKIQHYEINSKNVPIDVRPLNNYVTILTKAQQQMVIDRVNGEKQISRYWREINSGTAKGIYKLVTQNTFNGRRDQVMEFVSGEGEVGIDNMGLFRQGIDLRAGKNYEGTLRVKNPSATDLSVALISSDGKIKLAEKTLSLKPSPDAFQKVDFELIPGDSDHKGRFAVILKQPGKVTLGYAFLQPGPWGRVKGGYPIRQDFVDAIKANGMKIFRYNGSMNGNAADDGLYRWKYMIGPRDERICYTGTFNLYASHGFGFFEFLMLCEAAGIDGVVGISKYEDPAEIRNMIEYAKGPVTSTYGAMRAKDGHPDPLPLKYIEIGNSAGNNIDIFKAYIPLFKGLATEIWKTDPEIVIMAGGVLRQSPNFKPGEPNNETYNLYRDLLQWVKAQGHEAQYAQENHYSAGFGEDAALQNGFGITLQKYLADDIGFNLKLYDMEENGSSSNFQRGLYHAYLQNHINRWGDRISVTATANLFQPDIAVYLWDQGRIFWDSYRFWNSTSGYVDQMFTKEWLPWVLDTRDEAPADSLDILVKESEDGKVLSLYVVNYGIQARTRSFSMVNFNAKTDAVVTQLGPYPLTARNTGDNPDYIVPRSQPKKIWDSAFRHNFPGHSFTVVRLESNL